MTGRLTWTTVVPVLALALLALTWGDHPPGWIVAIVAAALIGAVLAAVHHAEVVAHRVGEPFGSLILAVAVTVIEVGLIVTLMVSGGDPQKTASLARDTVFAAVMISVNGIVGASVLVSALKHRLAVFNPEGSGAALATVVSLAALCLVLPTFTTTTPGPEFSSSQLTFAALASVVLYAMFVFTQTVRHRDFFLPVDRDGVTIEEGPVEVSGEAGAGTGGGGTGERHADPPAARDMWISLGLLVVALVSVVGLAKVTSPSIEDAVAALGFPAGVVGVVIALLVLLPESIAAVRAAAREQVQISLNLAYGSAIASIGLTIPTIAIASIWLTGPLYLGLEPTQIVLLVSSVVVGILTVVPGRAKPLAGGLHLVLLAAFVFLSISP